MLKARILPASGRCEVAFPAISSKGECTECSPRHRKVKTPAVSSVPIKGPGSGKQQHRDGKAKGQFEDPFPKASHALGKLTEPGNRRICRGQGVKAAGAVITDSDIWSLIQSEWRVLGAEAGTSPVPEENWNMKKWWQVHPSYLDF